MSIEMRRCTRCILPASYPRIRFDAEGVCSYCRAYDRQWRDWSETAGEAAFRKLAASARKRNARHSALVAFSGGKDSSYVLHLLVKKFDLNVIAFTYDNGFFPDEGKEIIANFTKKLGVEHRYMSLDRDVELRMYRALLKRRCADFCQICMLGMLAAANEFAVREKIPLVVWGFSPRTESTTPLELFLGTDYRYLLDVVEPDVKRSEFPLFRWVSLPRILHTMFIKRIRHVQLPQYVNWNEREMTNLLQKEYGWIDYGAGAPHFDCVANHAVDYFTHRRLGVSKVASKLSQLVRSGQLTRDEALERLRMKEQTEEPIESVRAVCERLGVTREELEPFLRGTTLDYRHFKSYSRFIERFGWLLWIAFKLGLLEETIYRKYSWKRS